MRDGFFLVAKSVLGLVALTAGCAPVGLDVPENSAPLVTTAATPGQCVRETTWVHATTGEARATPAVIANLAKSRVVLLGEFHDSQVHHLWQLQVLSALAGRVDSIAIGLEMLPRSAQPVLDKWVAGELSAEAFAKLSGWYEYWQFDLKLYLPLLDYARINRIPVYALNVSRTLVKQVHDKGWEGIPVADRMGITDPAAAEPGYVQMLYSTFNMHGQHAHGNGASVSQGSDQPMVDPLANPTFRRFVQGQQLWDRAMAQVIGDVLKETPNTLVVGIMGSGHIMNRYGVPHQLKDLGVNEVSVVVPWDQEYDCEMLEPGLADYVFGLTAMENPEQEKPRLGVQIEAAAKGVKVVKVVAGSIAEQAGVKDGDVILELASTAVRDAQSVVDIVRTVAPGTWLPLKISRGDSSTELVAKFPPSSVD